jgi:hypothetical protein
MQEILADGTARFDRPPPTLTALNKYFSYDANRTASRLHASS